MKQFPGSRDDFGTVFYNTSVHRNSFAFVQDAVPVYTILNVVSAPPHTPR